MRADHCGRHDWGLRSLGEHGDAAIDRTQLLAITPLTFWKEEERLTIGEYLDRLANGLGIVLAAANRKSADARDPPAKEAFEELRLGHESKLSGADRSDGGRVQVAEVYGSDDDRAPLGNVGLSDRLDPPLEPEVEPMGDPVDEPVPEAIRPPNPRFRSSNPASHAREYIARPVSYRV